jgi:hypothetical protein
LNSIFNCPASVLSNSTALEDCDMWRIIAVNTFGLPWYYFDLLSFREKHKKKSCIEKICHIFN